MEQETWKDILGYEGLYQVSNLGRVKSLGNLKFKNDKFIKFVIHMGYNRLQLSKYNNRKNLFVHRLVAQAFIPNPDNKPQVNHKDGNRLNNNLENIEWCTSKENIIHKFRVLGCKQSKPMKGKFGKLHHNSKKVNQYTLDGEFIKTWDCARDIQRELNISNSFISLCCKGIHKQAKGFIFKYKEN